MKKIAALGDMQFSNSNLCVINRHQPGFESSVVAFFPSCQLTATSPQSVRKIYEYLCEKIGGGVGLMLNCCGAPARWDGREGLFQETVKKIERHWRSLGSPKIITACPTCFNMLKHSLPDVCVEMLYTLFEYVGLPDKDVRAAVSPQKLAIHDSCTKGQDAKLYQSVRNILAKLGHYIEELPLNREHTVCCGYGGLRTYTSRKVVYEAINRRIKESETDYVAYCAMCRDNLASQGKRIHHLVDLIFGNNADDLAEREVPDYAQRQENRARLKTSLLREVWGDTVEEEQPSVNIIIPDGVRRVIDARRILLDDIIRVVAFAECSGNKFKNTENGHYIAYLKPYSVTYWVEYSPQGEELLVHNAYSHKMEVLECR